MSSRSRNARGRRGRREQDSDGWGEWGGYMAAKRQKLQDQFADETPVGLSRQASESGIFSGVTIHINGYTEPSSDELKRLMASHGGNYEHYLYRTRVTHVIATNLTDSKVRDLKGLKVVRPEWITESIKAEKLLSYTTYQLYTAKSGRQQGLSGFTKPISTESDQSSSHHGDDCDVDQSHKVDLIETLSKESFDLSENGDSFENDNTGSNISSNIDTAPVDSTTNSECPKSRSNSEVSKSGSRSDEHHSPAKAGDSRFLNEFYNNSRLHHLSTWKAELREYVNELQTKGDNFPGKEKLKNLVQQREILGIPDDCEEFRPSNGKPSRCIMHVDMDCFFVSVGLRKRPYLKGKPVAVTHSKGKGATPTPGSDLNYEKKQWALKRLNGGGRGKKSLDVGNAVPDNLRFPDQSDSEDEDEVTMETEPFHSMAEIASCSYEARKAGVRNGMLMGKAKSICPSLLTIPYDFEGYQEVTKILYDTVASYTHDIEAVSCDEMLVDCTDLLAVTGASPLEFATVLRQEILNKTGCNASAGLASNILLARMSTRKAKPNGQFHLEPELTPGFIKPQPIKDIPGVGWSLAKKFEVMNIVTCGDLQKISIDVLQKQFGYKTGQSLYRYCRGQDDRPIKMEHQRKSVSAEVNYGIRFTCESEAVRFVEELAEEACTRMRNIGMKGKHITLKLMIRRKDAPKETAKFLGHGICTNVSKSAMLPLATDDSRIVGKECVSIMRQQRAPVEDLRGIGIQIQKLEPAVVGAKSSLPKNQSILNFAVSKTSGNPVSHTSESHCTDSSDKLNQTTSSSRPNASVNSRLSVGQVNDLCLLVGDRRHVGDESYIDQPESVLHTDQSDVVLVQNQSASVLQTNQSVKGLDNNCEDQLERPTDISHACAIKEISLDNNTSDMVEEVVDQNCERNLLEEMARRQTNTDRLPPLPEWPEISTPDSNRKSRSAPSNTPENSGGTTDVANVDYFPSPSQVDPEVLKELPADIRDQIEKEMMSRQQQKTTASRRQTRSSVGCSHWSDGQEGGGANSVGGGVSDTGGGVSNIEGGVSNAGGGVSNSEGGVSEIRGGNANNRDDRNQDPIVALPSPSQLDVSCLNALPESMQNELRAAYAKRDATVKDSHNTGGNSMKLRQAGSPSTSPNKKSPGKSKKSPNFKVPRGRPATRGRKKGSSKKLLFKDQPLIATKISAAGVKTPLTTSDIVVIQDSQDSPVQPTDRFPSKGNIEIPSCSTSKSKTPPPTKPPRTTELTGVSLCGAVTLPEVRTLIKEWIYSTQSPQQEDEEVLIDYLQNLVLDKNLEQVDLVLKFLHRNVLRVDRGDWSLSVQRIFCETQYIVKSIYGSTLASI